MAKVSGGRIKKLDNQSLYVLRNQLWEFFLKAKHGLLCDPVCSYRELSVIKNVVSGGTKVILTAILLMLQHCSIMAAGKGKMIDIDCRINKPTDRYMYLYPSKTRHLAWGSFQISRPWISNHSELRRTERLVDIWSTGACALLPAC